MGHGEVFDALVERIRFLLRGDAQAVADAQTLIECVGNGHAQLSAAEIAHLAGRRALVAVGHGSCMAAE